MAVLIVFLMSFFPVLIDAMSGPGWWVQWVLGGWGIALALGARRALMPDRARLRARARRQVAKRRRGHWERQVRKEVDRAIHVGVDALVDAASRKLADKPRVRVATESGEVIEAAPGPTMFRTPQDPRTEDYITGRFG